jgi:hypothetical protein
MKKFDDIVLFGLDNEFSELKKAIDAAHNGNGSIYLVSGETNFGKSHLLKSLNKYANIEYDNMISGLVEVQAPIGDFQISNLKPLQPFQKIIEELIQNKDMSPEKKLAVNMTMSFFAALPLVGEFAYLAKEWKRDIKEFQGSKTGKAEDKLIIEEYIKALKKYSDKLPLVLLIDDIHWADVQSLELITELSKEINKLPIFMAVSYKPSDVQSKGLPILNLLKEVKNNDNFNKIELDVLQRNDITEASKYYIKNYKKDTDFDDWLKDKTFGVPGVIYEYLNYFKSNSPFNSEGLLINKLEDEYLPGSIQAVFSQKLALLNEEEKNILALCSSEGKQFTATIASELLNTDILDAIKKLRAIQNKTGIIKSLGAKKRYGAKTTVYEFTQGFYQNYFEKTLEYEEYTAIHGQIASLLKQKYAEADAEEIKQEIAPFLAAHSAEAGDTETAHKMLLDTAMSVKQFGSNDVLQSVLDRIKNYGSIDEEDTETLRQGGYEALFDDISNVFGFSNAAGQSEFAGGAGGSSDSKAGEPEISLDITYDVMKEKAIELYNRKKYKLVSEKCRAYVEQNDAKISSSQKSLLLLVSAKANSDIEDFANAEDDLNKVLNITEKTGDVEIMCMAYNVFAIIRNLQNENQKAMNYLNKAAQISFKIAPEIRLLTISNIAAITKESNPEMAEKYLESARALAKELDFRDFSNDLFELV